MEWTRSEHLAERLAPAAREYVQPSAWMFKHPLIGELPNRDTYLAESKLRSRTVVERAFRLRMRASWEHVVDDGKTDLTPSVKKWMRVSEAERIRIRDAVTAQLGTLFAAKEAELGLGTFEHHHPYRVFFASNERIEPQELHVAFAGDPSKEAMAAVGVAFREAVDRATR